jgi:hypothetical protein
LFNRCPFVDDRLRQLLREEMMNIHQHVLPTTTITIPNVYVLRTQTTNLNIGHTTIAVGKTNMLPISTYPMWYNVIPPFYAFRSLFVSKISN